MHDSASSRHFWRDIEKEFIRELSLKLMSFLISCFILSAHSHHTSPLYDHQWTKIAALWTVDLTLVVYWDLTKLTKSMFSLQLTSSLTGLTTVRILTYFTLLIQHPLELSLFGSMNVSSFIVCGCDFFALYVLNKSRNWNLVHHVAFLNLIAYNTPTGV